jgi:hypothetical protein
MLDPSVGENDGVDGNLIKAMQNVVDSLFSKIEVTQQYNNL